MDKESLCTIGFPMEESKQPNVAIVLITAGNVNTGKSSLSRRFANNEYKDEGIPATLGVQPYSTDQYVKGQYVRVLIHDTAGQEKYAPICRTYYNQAHGVLLVYDVTDKESFDRLSYWHGEVKLYTDPAVPVLLVGNKTDIADNRVNDSLQGKSFADENHLAGFVETSAKSGSNVEKAFDLLVTKVLENPTLYTPRIKNPGPVQGHEENTLVPEQPPPNTTAPTPTSEQQSKCCCNCALL